MFTIHKFHISRTAATERSCSVWLSPQARILHVGLQDEGFFLWAIVDTEQAYSEEHKIIIAGTGWPLKNQLKAGSLHHLNTILEDGGRLVWHVFELVNLPEFKA